jgi:integrase
MLTMMSPLMPGKLPLTDRIAASLKWTGKPQFIWDTEIKGFGVWIWGPSENSRAYVVQAKHHGISRRKSLGPVNGTKIANARYDAIKFKSLLRTGVDPNAERNAPPVPPVPQVPDEWTVQDAVDFLRGTEADARGHSAGHRERNEKGYQHHTPPMWAHLPLASITRAMVVAQHRTITRGTKYADSRATGGARRANQWLSFISTLYTTAALEGKFKGDNPCANIRRNDESERDRYLSPVEMKTLWDFLSKHENVQTAAVVKFILLTGCRPGEAFKAKWADIDDHAGRWTKLKTKQQKIHRVLLNDSALDVLASLNTRDYSEYIFPSPLDPTMPRKDVKTFWRIVRKQCRLADVRLYDLRHTFGSWLAMHGATAIQIGAQLGHSDPKSTQRYVHLAETSLRETSQIMDSVLRDALSPDQIPVRATKLRNGNTREQLNSLSLFFDEDEQAE